MQLTMSSSRVVIGPSLRDHIERRLETTLNGLGRWIQRDSTGLSNGYLSVLDPIGFAMLGCRVSDGIVAKGPSGVRRLQLVEVLY